MCDRHRGKDLSHYCLVHDEIICAQCAIEEHSQLPCDSMHLAKSAKHLRTKIQISASELKKLKGVSQSILDGKRQDETTRVIAGAEKILDEYTDEMKKKLQRARLSIRPFSELSREERWKLKAVATKRIPNDVPAHDGDDSESEAKELITRLREIKKQMNTANEALNSLPSYVEVSVNPEFTDSLNFSGNPIFISKQGEADIVSESASTDRASTAYTVSQESVYLIQKSSFQHEHCTDIVLMDEYLIASVGDSVQKKDRKRMSFRQGLTLPAPQILSRIGMSTEVAVLQRVGCISVVETHPNLAILYKISIEKPYTDFCYLGSVVGKPGCPNPSPSFVVCYTKPELFMSNYVDIIRSKRTRFPGRLPAYAVEERTIADSLTGRNKSRYRGVTNVCALHGRHIVIGSSKGITCVNKTGLLIWTIDLFKDITQIISNRSLVYVSILKENRIITVGTQGHVIGENILPPRTVTPERMGADDDTLVVKNLGTYNWVLFKQIFEDLQM